MTDPSASRRTALVAAATALVLSSILTGCSGLFDPVPIAPPSPVARATQQPSPSPTPTASPVRPTPSVLAPTPSPTVQIPEAAAPKPQWEAASTTFKNRANALKRLAKLRAKGFTGYKIEKDKDRYEVEREFSTERRAAAEVRRLARAGFRAKVEASTEPT
jgi:cell division septation protein DedD